MSTPKKPQTPSKVDQRTPQKNSPRTPSIRTPGSPAPSPNETVTPKYSAGVLPISYTWNEDRKERIWQILFCIEFRSLEKRLCLHPLAGKKETIDDNVPWKTALREFTEESYGVFKDFNLKTELIDACASESWTYIPSSKMYLFFAYIPYKQDIQQLYLQAKGENAQGSALVWIPFDDFLKSRYKITARYDGKDIEPSDCFRAWLKMDEIETGYNKIRERILKRLERSDSPIEQSGIPQDNKEVDVLSDALRDTKVHVEEDPKANKKGENLVKPLDS